MSFSTGIAIAKDFAKASVNGTIDNIQFPFSLALLMLSLRAQCERKLKFLRVGKNFGGMEKMFWGKGQQNIFGGEVTNLFWG